LNTEAYVENSDENGHPTSNLPDLEINMVRLKCSLTRDVKENTILADNGATHTIIYEDWASLVEDFEEVEGNVTGSTQGTLGTVVGKGTIHFFGEKLNCYLANITTSVLSIGQTCGRPHFMEWRLQGNSCTIMNHNTSRIFTIDKQGNNLYPIPPTYFIQWKKYLQHQPKYHQHCVDLKEMNEFETENSTL
jgi:hypothetical protein